MTDSVQVLEAVEVDAPGLVRVHVGRLRVWTSVAEEECFADSVVFASQDDVAGGFLRGRLLSDGGRLSGGDLNAEGHGFGAMVLLVIRWRDCCCV